MKRLQILVAGASLCALLTASAAAGPYEDGRKALDAKDYAAARSDFNEAAAQGDARAQAFLGIMYKFGMGVPADLKQAAQWLTLAADAGDAGGQSQLGDLYLDGQGVARNPAQAARYYAMAAAQNDVPALFKLGALYENGLGLDKDPRRALELYRVAAKAGNADAVFRIAYFYFYGVNLPKNFDNAVALLKYAADEGQADALALLGYAYDNGYGVAQSGERAVVYYARAAAKGSPNGMALLGEKYAAGHGVAQDWGRAYTLLSLAAAKSDGQPRDAETKERDEAALHLDDAAIARAKTETEQCLASGFTHCVLADDADKLSRNPSLLELHGTGTGFFVSKAGELVTNNHVVQGCAEMRLDGKAVTVVAADKDVDLAIIATGKPRTAITHLRGSKGAVLGENVVAVGFPLNNILGRDPIVTSGVLSSLKGLNGNVHEMQFSAPIQPGNSGGPLLGEDGAVVGVAHAVLDGLVAADAFGVIPENVNFAVTLGALTDYLKAHKIAYVTETGAARKNTAAIAGEAQRYTVLLECWK